MIVARQGYGLAACGLAMTALALPAWSQTTPAPAPGTETTVNPPTTALPGPGATSSGWSDIGVWGAVILAVIIIVVAWLVFRRRGRTR